MQTEFAVSGRRRSPHIRLAAMATLAVSLVFGASPVLAQTLERIAESGHIRLGYLEDAAPFTFRNQAGRAEGYSVTLCEKIADYVGQTLELPSVAVDWVPVTIATRVSQIEQGNIDLLCAPISETLSRRQDVAFSIPVFPGGLRAVMRNDAATALQAAIAATRQEDRVIWRGSPAATVLGKKTFAVVAGTPAESWLSEKLKTFQVDARIVPVADYRSALQDLLDRDIDVFFGDRVLVLGAMDDAARAKLTILPRLLTHEPFSLAMARNDDDFRLVVDSALSGIFADPDFGAQYAACCGEFDDATRAFFLWNTLGR